MRLLGLLARKPDAESLILVGYEAGETTGFMVASNNARGSHTPTRPVKEDGNPVESRSDPMERLDPVIHVG